MTQVGFTPSPELFPFESRWFESSVGRVHYVDEGSGRPLLLLHGNPMWSFSFREVISSLRDRFRCVAPDYPGFGLSDRPEGYGYTGAEHAGVVEELVRALDLQDTVMVLGPNWGGPIGMAVATSMPERVGGLVVGNNWWWPSDHWMGTFSRIMSTGPAQRAVLEKNVFVEKILQLWTKRRMTAEVMEHYRAVMPTPESRVGAARLPVEIAAARPWLAEIAARVPETVGDKPALVVWGMRDHAFVWWFLNRRVRKFLPNHEVLKLRKAMHYVYEEDPEAIAGAIAKSFG